MNRLLRKFSRQVKSLTNNPIEISFCGHLLTILHTINSRLNATVTLSTNVDLQIIQNIIKWFNLPDKEKKQAEELLLTISLALFNDVSKCYQIMVLYKQIFNLHLNLKPLLYFYDSKYDANADKQTIDQLQCILSSISCFNNECIKLLSNQYAHLIKFAKLSWLDLKKYVK